MDCNCLLITLSLFVILLGLKEELLLEEERLLELELELELFDELLEVVLPVLACAIDVIPKRIISMMTTHELVSFFILFSFLSASYFKYTAQSQMSFRIILRFQILPSFIITG